MPDVSVAITGVGLVTALGLSADETWRAVLAGRDARGPLPAVESPLPAGADGYQAAELPADYRPDLPRETRYLRYAIESALMDASAPPPLEGGGGGRGSSTVKPLDPSKNPPPSPPPQGGREKTAVVLGTTLHGMRAAGRFYRSKDHAHLRHFLAGDVLRHAVDGLGLAGESLTTCSACSSSLGAVALGMTMLRAGTADVVVAGGYDTVSEYVWAGFNALRLVADGPLRPFGAGRRGMKLGEGYAVVVLERVADAERRGARIVSVVSGYGESADAHHLTQPQPQGQGAAAAMAAALTQAGVTACDIGLVSAHATGTPDNDSAEFAAMAHVLGDALPTTPVVCLKTHLGHTLGAAGAAELVLTAFALRDGVLPPTANPDATPTEYAGLRVTATEPVRAALRHTLGTSLGFGGANTSVVTSALAHAPRPRRSVARREVWITGLGVVLPGAVGKSAFVDRLEGRTERPAVLRIADAEFEHLLNARRVRRMSGYAKLMLAAATEACAEAKLTGDAVALAATGAVLGTTHGASPFSDDYYSRIVRDGVTAANPVLFAEGVPNVGAAQLSLMLGLRGGCQTIIGTRTSGLDALRLAWLRVASGEADRLIVGAAEESSDVVERVYADEFPGLRTSPGAVAMVIESADSARARGVTARAVVENAAGCGDSARRLPRSVARVIDAVGDVADWCGSANGTRTDRVEAAAFARRGIQPAGGGYALFGEPFSVQPLAALAMAMSHDDMTGRAAVLCTDWQGHAATTTIRRADRFPAVP